MGHSSFSAAVLCLAAATAIAPCAQGRLVYKYGPLGGSLRFVGDYGGQRRARESRPLMVRFIPSGRSSPSFTFQMPSSSPGRYDRDVDDSFFSPDDDDSEGLLEGPKSPLEKLLRSYTM